ncbi:MAG TPA: histidine kinase [Saprospiraceae bacterium]|nr:histidine kinase [Saprospiraceae bacterium]
MIHGYAGKSQLPDYHVQIFDERHGLRTDMDHVIRDKSGFVWLMYSDRVQRFDGKNVNEFYVGENLVAIFSDITGDVWVTAKKSVYRFENSKKGFIPIPVDSTKDITIGSVFQFPGKEVWIITSQGFYAYDRSRSGFYPVTDEKFKTNLPVNVRRYTNDLWENIFFYNCRDTIWAQNFETGHKEYLPFKGLYGLHALNDHQLIISSWKGHTFFYDFQKQEIENIIPHEFIENTEDDFLVIHSVLNLDAEHHLIATTKGILKFNSSTGEIKLEKLYYKGQPLSGSGRIMDLYMDHERKIWACSDYHLLTFDPSTSGIGLMRSIETDPLKSFSNVIRGFAADEEGNLWMPSFNSLVFWDIHKNEFQPYFAVEGATDKMNHPSIRGIAYDGKYVIIGQTNKGVWLYDPIQKSYRRPVYEEGDMGEMTRIKLENDFIDQIYTLHNGHHIIVARDGGYVMDMSAYRIRQIHFPGEKENLNFCYEDNFRQVWLGTYKGIYCLDSNLVFKFQVKDGVGPGLMRSFFQWDDHEYILGAQGLFLIQIQDGNIEVKTLNHFFDHKNINSIFRDKLHRLWLGTDDGLYLFDRKREYIDLYDRYDNMQGDVYCSNAFYQNKEGVLFVGGTNGINYFKPEEIKDRTDSLVVSLVTISVNQDDSSYFDRENLLTLAPVENNIEINYIAPFYGNSNRLKYKYRLMGLSPEWKNAGNVNTIRFTALPPGSYKFNLAASFNGIDWTESKDTLLFKIAYPVWQKWWFILCCICIVCGFLIYMVRRRINSIRKNEKVKRDYERRIAEVEMHALRAQMNPHFMFNSLNSINNFILKNDPDNASGYLTKFSRLMRLILDNSRSEWVLLENELKALELYIQLEVVRFDHVFDYDINVSPEIDVTTTSIPPMIIQPYVENAIWHGLLHRNKPGGKLWIRFTKERQGLIITIEDNGVGRQEAQRLKSKSATKHKSHGMKITAERIEIVNRIYNVNAHVQIDDVPGVNGHAGGTRVSLTMQNLNHDGYHR